MLDLESLQSKLPQYGLGEPVYYFESVGSTNEVAIEYAHRNVPHGALFIADEQTAGRGRDGRRWYTTPKSALAFSLVLRPQIKHAESVGFLTVLGTLAIVEALDQWKLDAEIKWPNDVLIAGKKVAGVLVEAVWIGDKLEYAILGVGINVGPDSVPSDKVVDYPATCVEAVVNGKVDRNELLLEVLKSMGCWYSKIENDDIREAWERRLAFQGEQVVVTGWKERMLGTVMGVEVDGTLQLVLPSGEQVAVAVGDVRLRPVDTNSKSTTLGV
ncbi:MAG: biotin--[acetyl-CoA-carboxylase] ligase [Anaerolineales bacterium]|nr:biotin--[acetyl-CoA-carboxylase] ligase [Anaerolineales bacterium]